MTSGRVLVAGVGNVFLGDDGFGSAVAQRLGQTPLPSGVRVEDFGIRGMHLAYEMLNDYGRVIIVDAAPRGERPGTVTILEPARDGVVPGPPDAHGMSPEAVLGLVDALGGTSAEVLVVACEPATTEEGMDLSAPVREAVDVAADAVRQLVNGGS